MLQELPDTSAVQVPETSTKQNSKEKEAIESMIIALRAQGIKCRDIADRVGKPVHYVWGVNQKMGPTREKVNLADIPEHDDVLTLEEAAAALGVSHVTVLRWRKNGRLKKYRIR